MDACESINYGALAIILERIRDHIIPPAKMLMTGGINDLDWAGKWIKVSPRWAVCV